jgi:glycosyltransferase involved in cell wall biosynthesis
MRRKKILCFTSYYLPGFKSGGPLRSLLHMQEWLGDDFEFGVVSRDRDAGDDGPYDGLATGTWHNVRGVKVWYLAQPFWRPRPLWSAIAGFRPDALYFHSSVDPALTIIPLVLRRLHWIPSDLPVLVAPRGEFSPGARSLKARKKNMYFLIARILGLYRDVTWHATKEEEAAQIRALWGGNLRIVVAPNLPGRLPPETTVRRRAKEPGTLRLVFLSRICRMKNLHGALEILRGVTAPVTLDIHGIQEDADYWAQCADLIDKLPANVRATYRGVVPPDEAIATLAAYDALFLPTLGENFGHVIHESLLAGCPVLISDQTPWRALAAERVGFDIPLDRPELSRQAIEQLAAMDSRGHQTWSESARAYGIRYSSDLELVERTRAMLAMVAPA